MHHCAGWLCRKVTCAFVLRQWNWSYLEIAFTFWFTLVYHLLSLNSRLFGPQVSVWTCWWWRQSHPCLELNCDHPASNEWIK
jgi:hypothetical protein